MTGWGDVHALGVGCERLGSSCDCVSHQDAARAGTMSVTTVNRW